MHKDNLFFKNRIPIILLLTTFIIYVICYWKSASGLYFDIPAMFSSAFYNHCENPDSFSIFMDARIRYFTNFLVGIPYNVIFQFIKDEPALTSLKAFSTSYFIIHFILLLLNFLVAKRTKRYDIAIIAFAFYFLLTIPSAIWIVRELHTAYFFYFIILSYFLSKEKLNIWDTIPITLAGTYIFESLEISLVFSLIMFIFSIIYIVNKEKNVNIIHKSIICLLSLGVLFYIPAKLQIMNNSGTLDFSSGTKEWLYDSFYALSNLFNSNLLIPLFGILAMILAFIYKKELRKKEIILLICYTIISITIIYIQTGFLSNPRNEENNYSPVLWFIFPTIITLICFDYFNLNIEKRNPYFYSHLILITCIFGCINLLWQINSCFEFIEYKSYLEKTIENSRTTIIRIPNEEFKNNNILRYATCFGFSQQSIFLTEKNKKAKIILPTKECPIYIEKYCAEGPDETYYDAKEDRLILQSSFFKTKTKYWDLTPIAEELKKRGRVK